MDVDCHYMITQECMDACMYCDMETNDSKIHKNNTLTKLYCILILCVPLKYCRITKLCTKYISQSCSYLCHVSITVKCVVCTCSVNALYAFMILCVCYVLLIGKCYLVKLKLHHTAWMKGLCGYGTPYMCVYSM